jgi:hypothetical protein
MRTIAKLVGILALILAASGTAVVGATQARSAPAAKASPSKDWPDARTLEKRRTEAEKLPLFAGTDPVVLTLTADFKAIQGDRNPESTKVFPATIQFAGADGAPVTMDLQVRTRGHARRSYNVCDFAPLRLEFPKDRTKGTVFEGQTGIKLGVHCREGVKEFEQYVLREYAAYRIYNLLTAQSFRARLARVTYVDSAKRRSTSTRYAMFIEDDDDVAKRMGGRVTDAKDALAKLDRDAFTRMTLFEYMIGNLDVSILAQHNVRNVQMPAGTVYPVPYDFDYSGLVNATYAQPPPGLGITTVRDRVFRGPCRQTSELDTLFAEFRAVRPILPPMYDTLPDLFDAGAKKQAIGYLDQFYKTIDSPDAVKRAFMDACLKRGLM